MVIAGTGVEPVWCGYGPHEGPFLKPAIILLDQCQTHPNPAQLAIHNYCNSFCLHYNGQTGQHPSIRVATTHTAIIHMFNFTIFTRLLVKWSLMSLAPQLVWLALNRYEMLAICLFHNKRHLIIK